MADSPMSEVEQIRDRMRIEIAGRDAEIERLKALPREVYDWLQATNPGVDESTFQEAHTLVVVVEAGGPDAWEAEMARIERAIADGTFTPGAP